MVRWFAKLGWQRQLALAAVVATAVVAGVLTRLGHEVAATSLGVLSALGTVAGAYDHFIGKEDREDGKRARSSLVVVYHLHEDRRWALWIGDRLNAAGFMPRLELVSAGQGPGSASRWAKLTISNASCALIVLSARVQEIDPSMRARLTALASTRRAQNRLVRVDTDGLGTLPALASLPGVSVASILQPDRAWQEISDAIRDRGARPDQLRADAFGSLSAPFPGIGVINASLPEANPNFVGREAELSDLNAKLTNARGDVTARSMAIYAMSGMGKTQLAAQFAISQRALEIVWWIHAHQPAAIYADLAALAQKLGLPEVANQSEMLRQLWERLRTYEGRWLLVYDNAESEDKLHDLIPTAGDGSLLITSQSPNWATRVRHRKELDHMSPADSVELLRRRVPVPDESVLVQIAERLGWLPLSLEQAASYMSAAQCTPANYLHELTERFTDVLAHGSQAYYDKSATTTYRLAREQTTKIEPLCGVLLELCSFFSPEAIPRDLFEDPGQAEALDDELRAALAEGLPYNAAVSAARQFSLLGVTPQSFTLHRVVQRLIRDDLTSQVRDRRLTVAIRLLARAYPLEPNDPRTWEACDALQSHCVTALTEVEIRGLVSPVSIRLNRRVGEYQLVRGAFDAALKRLTKTLDQLHVHADNPADLAPTELALSRVYYQQADLRRAKEHAEAALRLNESIGREDGITAAILLELSKVQLELTEFQAARSSADRSLAIHQNMGAPADLVGLSLETLGIVKWRLGAWEEAEANLRDSVSLLAKALGPESGVTARARTCWALVLRDSARRDAIKLGRAEAQFQLAHIALKSAYGTDHPDTCSAAIHLADTQHRLARAQGSDSDLGALSDEYRRIAADFEEIMERLPLRAQKPGRACGLVRQGHLLNNAGDHERARQLVHEARGIYIQSYGPEHPYVAEALTRLIGIEYDLGNVDQSGQYAREARKIYAEKYGETHPYVKQIDEFVANPAVAGRD